MKCRWTTERDLKTYISNGIFRYKGEAVWAFYKGQPGEVNLYTLDKKNLIKAIDSTDPEFDVSTPPLGYFMWGNQVLEMQKLPTRQYNKGINEYNVSIWDLQGNAGTVYVGSLWTDPGLKGLIEGHGYPNKEDIWDLLKQKPVLAYTKEIAFQKLAVGITLVFYKGDNIGYILPDEKTIKIKDDDTHFVVQRYFPEFKIEFEVSKGD